MKYMGTGEEEGTCEEIGHVWVQPLHHIHGIIKEEDRVVIAVEEPLEAVAKVPGFQESSHWLPVCNLQFRCVSTAVKSTQIPAAELC